MTLKAINKDRRCKLTTDDIDMIKAYYNGYKLPMTEIARTMNISRQRVGQILDLKGTRRSIIDKQVAHNKMRYHNDSGYRSRFLDTKKQSYYYKVSTISNK